MGSTFLAVTSSYALFGEIGASKSVSTTPFKIADSSKETRTTCAVWGADGSAYIATQDGSVDKYNRQGVHTGTVYADSSAIVALAVKDGQVIVGHEGSISLVDTASGKQGDTQIPVTGRLKSLSLSHDKELLAITTSSGVYIYNLSTNVVTALNTRNHSNGFVCGTFHPHRRTTLLVGCGPQVIVFDTLKPNAPTQTITMGTNQQVVALCFSASIRGPVAVATRSGNVQMIDLEKEKSNVSQTFDFKVELCAVAISADNTLLIAGTADGKALLQEIRAADKPVQTTAIGSGEAVIMLTSLPKRPIRTTATTISAKAVTTTKASTRSQPLGDSNAQRKPVKTLARKVSEESTASKKEQDPKPAQANTPIKRPLVKEIIARASSETMRPTRTRSATNLIQQRNSPLSRRPSPRVSSEKGSPAASPVRSPVMASRVTVRPLLVKKRISNSSPMSAKPRPSSRFSQATTERLPSPDLPAWSVESMPHLSSSPLNLEQQKLPEEVKTAERPKTPAPPIGLSESPKVDRAMLGLDTSDIQRWIAQEAKSRDLTASPTNMNDDTRSSTPSPASRTTIQPLIQPRLAKIQGLPVKPLPPSRRSSANIFGPDSGAVQLSPMRSPALPGMGQANSVVAQEFIRSVVREAMTEHQEEQLGELRAMHLDMVKMGRTWKNELRNLMQEYVGDFKVLHEENALLRAENERLRRGY